MYHSLVPTDITARILATTFRSPAWSLPKVMDFVSAHVAEVNHADGTFWVGDTRYVVAWNGARSNKTCAWTIRFSYQREV